jgi:hypothetical protein
MDKGSGGLCEEGGVEGGESWGRGGEEGLAAAPGGRAGAGGGGLGEGGQGAVFICGEGAVRRGELFFCASSPVYDSLCTEERPPPLLDDGLARCGHRHGEALRREYVNVGYYGLRVARGLGFVAGGG